MSSTELDLHPCSIHRNADIRKGLGTLIPDLP
jgi:hypothetical protein